MESETHCKLESTKKKKKKKKRTNKKQKTVTKQIMTTKTIIIAIKPKIERKNNKTIRAQIGCFSLKKATKN